MDDLLIDQEFRTLIPPLSPEEYAGLEQSIIAEGNRVPIDTWRGYIVDGHNRYDICHKHNIPLKTANELKLETKDDVKVWIINNQLNRRNLESPVRIELVIQKHDITLKMQARERIKEHANTAPGRTATPTQTFGEVLHKKETDAIIGKEAGGISRETVRKYRHVRTKSTPEQKEKLKKGELSINEAYNEVKKQERQKRLEAEIEANRRTLPSGSLPENNIFTGDYSILYEKLADDSIDLFFTDPPYDEKSIELYEGLAKLAQLKLKPGGICLAYASHAHLDEYIKRMTNYLDYWWIFSVFQTGGEARIWNNKIWVGWKPILAFIKKPTAARLTDTWFRDAITGNGDDKRFHKWGQDIREATYWIESLTTPSSIVVDPFTGGGTIPMASKLTGRKWIGTEIEPETANIARKRINEDINGAN